MRISKQYVNHSDVSQQSLLAWQVKLMSLITLVTVDQISKVMCPCRLPLTLPIYF